MLSLGLFLALPLAVVSSVSDLYDEAPDHPWNQLHAALARTDLPAEGADHFLFGVGDAEGAKRALSTFLDDRSDRAIDEDRSRALLQRDLWAIFDQTDARTSKRFKSLLASGIRRLALPTERIVALESALPPESVVHQLLDPDGEFVEVEDANQFDLRSIAPAHDREVAHRSYFTVHFSVPPSREATFAWLETLNRFDAPLVGDARGGLYLNRDIPQLPAGSRVALVRRALLVDDGGEPVATGMVESVQMRTFHKFVPPAHTLASTFEGSQSVDMWLLDRRAWLRGGASLRRVGREEEVVNLFRDRYKRRADANVALQMCAGCHAAAGIVSVNSWKRDEVGCATDGFSIPRFELPRRLLPASEGGASAARNAIAAKRQEAQYGALTALW